MKGSTFQCLCVSFLGGILAASFLPLKYAMCGAVLIAFGATPFVFRRFRCWRNVLLVVLMAALFAFGVWRYEMTEITEYPLDRVIGETSTFHGRICAEPEDREFDQRFCFEPDDGDGRILVRAPRFPRLHIGDRLALTGKIELPQNFESYEGGPEFDYVSHLGKDSIRYVMSRPKIADLGENDAGFVVRGLVAIKRAFMGMVSRIMPEPSASLVGGILLGEKGMMPKDLGEAFRRSGLTHILVLSGSNVTVVAESLLRAFSFLPRMYGQWLGAGSIVLFAIMTGASTTTVRATFMALIGLLARGTGRRYDVMRALSLAALVMVVHNPRVLAFDISFQLSFLATLAIIFVSPLIKERLGFVTERFAVRETLAMTLGTQIFTLPFIVWKMGEISLIALIPNLLVLPIVPLAMLGGFLAGTAGLIWEPLGLPFAWATDAMLSYSVVVVEYFGGLGFATVKTRFSAPLLVLSYVFMTLAIWWLTARSRNSAPQNPN
ncbi:MAG: ComEC/Rec2 family competence protein [bacterium]|nr:ComEC/Rec2 family competence protein [bacterium]